MTLHAHQMPDERDRATAIIAVVAATTDCQASAVDVPAGVRVRT